MTPTDSDLTSPAAAVPSSRTDRNSSSSSSASASHHHNPLSHGIALARERFQSSAREWMKNLEDAVLSTTTSASSTTAVTPTASTTPNSATPSPRRELHRLPDASASLKEGAASIEQALRLMFHSCTSGAADQVIPSTEAPSGATTGQQQGESPWPPTTAPSPLSLKTTPPQPVAATRSQSHPPTSSSASSRLRGTPSPRRRTIVASTPPLGENIYAQLFHEDAIAAAGRTTSTNSHTMYTTPEQRRHSSIPKPFPMSSPPRTDPVPSAELHLPQNLTFDDSISAISAHTLEAMAYAVPRDRSDLTSKESSTLFSSSLLMSQSSPLDLPQTPSSATLGRNRSLSSGRHSLPSKDSSKGGGVSKHSKGTLTTESSGISFDIWQAQEQEYWETVVADEEEGEEQILHRQSLIVPQPPPSRSARGAPPKAHHHIHTRHGRKDNSTRRHPHDPFPEWLHEETTPSGGKRELVVGQPIVRHNFSKSPSVRQQQQGVEEEQEVEFGEI